MPSLTSTNVLAPVDLPSLPFDVFVPRQGDTMLSEKTNLYFDAGLYSTRLKQSTIRHSSRSSTFHPQSGRKGLLRRRRFRCKNEGGDVEPDGLALFGTTDSGTLTFWPLQQGRPAFRLRLTCSLSANSDTETPPRQKAITVPEIGRFCRRLKEEESISSAKGEAASLGH
ncbi:unnamed protein product, partial [Protopolystoma xenopodis]